MKYPFGTLPSSLRRGRGCLSFGFPPLSSQSINPQPGRGLGSELKNTFWPDLELLAEWFNLENLRAGSIPRLFLVILRNRVLYWSPRAATTNCQNLGGLKQ